MLDPGWVVMFEFVIELLDSQKTVLYQIRLGIDKNDILVIILMDFSIL